MQIDKKKALKTSAVLATTLLIGSGIFAFNQYDVFNKEDNIKFSLVEDKVSVSSENKYRFVQKSHSSKKGIRASDDTTIFKVFDGSEKIGTYSITIREIDNGDKFVFNRFINTQKTNPESDKYVENLPLQVTIQDVKNYDLFAFDDVKVVREHDSTFGVDLTTNVKGLYSFSDQQGEVDYNLYLSQNYISKELKTKYGNGEESVLRKLVDENKKFSIQKQGNGFRFNLELRTTDGAQVSESWFLLSEEQLFKSKATTQSYKDKTTYYFIHNPKWSTADGNYTKLPWSVEPFDEMGYGRNLVSLRDKMALDSYEKTQERFYYNMVINSINYLMDFKDSDDKLWETEYTSTWLKKSYGIQAPYTDTRHNENIALFLTRAGELLDIEEIKKAYVLYANFLSNQKAIGNVIETEQGYYVADYFSETQENKTHVSLNHALAEMNFLLETYVTSKNEQHLETAMNIKRAVEETGIDWINPKNGDFWYQINGDYTFNAKDYPTLTLEDIAKSLAIFEEMNIAYEPVLKEMIKSKLDFVISNETPIPLGTVQQLKALGFTQELNDYRFVIQF